MTYDNDALYDFKAYRQGRPPRASLPQNIFGGAALAFVALACVWSVYTNLAGDRADPIVTEQPVAPPGLMEPAASMASAAPVTPTASTPTTPPVDPDTYLLLFDPAYASIALHRDLAGGAPRDLADLVVAPTSSDAATTAQFVAPPQPHQLAHIVPMPVPRPSELQAPPSQNAALHRRAQANKVVAAPAEDRRSIFEKLFGIPQKSGDSLAYAAPDGGVSGDGQSLPSTRSGLYDRWTAVYDISAHTVYLPDGSKLEAHSGLGSRLDDPHHVHERMRGATPPHIYDLKMRESLFHGVRAIRLIPVGGEGNIFGRSGLLAHTYMLGPNGDSNGCVSFRNYTAFLRAFQNGEIKRLVVVARLS